MTGAEHSITLLSWTQAAALLGAGVCAGLGAIGAALGEGNTARAGAEAMARQPGAADKILYTMLLGQAVAESSSIFALVISVILVFNDWTGSAVEAAGAFSAGLTMGLGSIGPGLGSGLASEAACTGIGRNPNAAHGVRNIMLVGQAVAQSPAVFALMISLMLIYNGINGNGGGENLGSMAAALGAALSMGLGSIGPGFGAGEVAKAAVLGAAKNPKAHDALMGTMITGQAVSQSTAIYSLMVAMVLVLLA